MWDMTSDVGIPVYCCSIKDTNPFGPIQSFGGSGCHLSKEIALSRALTEAAQSRLTFIAGSRDDLFPDLYEPAQDTPGVAATGPVLDFRTRKSPGLGATFAEDLADHGRSSPRRGFPARDCGGPHEAGVRHPGRGGCRARRPRAGDRLT